MAGAFASLLPLRDGTNIREVALDLDGMFERVRREERDSAVTAPPAAPLEDDFPPEARKGYDRWAALAYALGYNELTKHAKVLGEKIFFRLGRDVAVKRFVELGGHSNLFAREDSVLELETQDRMPHIKFKASDIELMRETVRIYDEEAGK